MAKEEKTVAKEAAKSVELCAIPREFAEQKLKSIYEENKSAFDEYQFWLDVFNAQVNVVKQPKSNEEEVV